MVCLWNICVNTLHKGDNIFNIIIIIIIIIIKESIPSQAWTGPKGSRRLKPLDFKTIGT
jgi:hypothetical protein